jgi:hypothetical protein
LGLLSDSILSNIDDDDVKSGDVSWAHSISSEIQSHENPTSSSAALSLKPPRRSNNGWLALVDQVDSSWRQTIRPLFQHYTERTPGSFIEEKEINLTWHYRNSDPEFGSWQVHVSKILIHIIILTPFVGGRTSCQS